ncbi:hypothetical protein DO97_16625 [Neosynechococcus sphagnicola sy1]|uniref:Uncharacterized protein n=1 Tax=Neosynechococcus sphagnicola sy1 TaxID=1497020 RepID=A0A098TMQ8_9CYAN|nr:hypothetical protein [Neosynechococcus sphagnicola]KGF73605.1 hypothetical protein DO97_16625 [Neosynechococcus sphagnicola sy1]
MHLDPPAPITPTDIAPAIAPSSPLAAVGQPALAPLDSVDHPLRWLCSEAQITKEQLAEAAYIVCVKQPQVMQEIVQVARLRAQEQKHAEELKRLKTLDSQSKQDSISLWLL